MYLSGSFICAAAAWPPGVLSRRELEIRALCLPWQAEMDMMTWGVDLASVEQHISSHRSIHNAIGDYRWQLDKIKADLAPTPEGRLQPVPWVPIGAWLLL